jgi:hypothetical protein
MVRRPESRGISRSVLVVIALYAIALSLEPVLHHDFVCHHHSPTHCVSCMSSQCAPGVEPGAEAVTTFLRAAGTLEFRAAPAVETVALTRTTGRSPPA